MYFWYYPEIDRFAVTDVRSLPGIEDVRRSIHYTGLEYVRYVPLGDISLHAVNNILARKPRETCFEVNRACNLRCPICIAGAEPHSDVSLPFTRFKQALWKSDDAVTRVTLTGGEPTLHPDLRRFVHAAAERAEGVVIATNGYEPVLLQNALSGVVGLTVTVSLHGDRSVHDDFVGQRGAFDRALETIRRSVDQGQRVEVLTTAFRQAIDSLPLLMKSLASIAISEHRINLVKGRGRIKREPASWGEVATAVLEARPNHKLTIKRRDQPFLFVSCHGEEEQRYGENSRPIRN